MPGIGIWFLACLDTALREGADPRTQLPMPGTMLPPSLKCQPSIHDHCCQALFPPNDKTEAPDSVYWEV